jgi:hypothetical protein
MATTPPSGAPVSPAATLHDHRTALMALAGFSRKLAESFGSPVGRGDQERFEMALRHVAETRAAYDAAVNLMILDQAGRSDRSN